MPDLTVTLVQADLAWEDPAANREALGRRLADVPPGADLVVLPEMFSTGFTMEGARVAEAMDGPTPAWMRAQAQHLGAVLAGSAVIRTAAGLFNRFLWVPPEGPVGTYDKRHLFRMAGEHRRFAAGSVPLAVDWRGARFCPLVCYDLRFPVWSRRRATLDYDVLVYVANWPAPRHYAWQQLLRARAIENQAFVLGVNRVGPDGNGVAYSGGSAAIDALGEPLVELGDRPETATVTLDLAAQRGLRERFPVERDADPFTLVAGGERR